MARARAKLMIYGSAAKQYARVWDYVKALMQYNPGTECNVVVDGLEQIEPPIILENILVAVGKDGNNNIYPIAWATAEIENTETWVWFLESLMKALKDEERGLGYTFISDRQKGLVEALHQVVPYADTRYCFDFEVAMESIRFLSEEDFEYLSDIPAKHWSRHAFSTFPKSNMLLNNICETFNVVMKEARDKPILTQMEWLRRYAMKRNNDKWEAFLKMEGKVVPYVKKVFQRIEPVARHCIVQLSRGDSYEVQLNSDQVTVDLNKATCTCFHWELLEIAPMPGPRHWERVKLRQPLPPAIKVQLGRPKSKKRKLEQGEMGGQNQQVQQPLNRRATCKNCGQLGHYDKTCKNPPLTPVVVSSPKKEGGRPHLDTNWVKNQRKRRVEKALKKSAVGGTPGPNSIGSKRFPQEEQQRKQQQQQDTQ
ncbi:uncharacterized protein LOC110697723 [Chenopodium quinoa]|uniref:uncharacterized protein LOC110697723 n=1 Tax=Chenopodium quinoa TaxID=63459 RepID=UPI000B78569B|nr:uncharacterized protein LOC110697723 [Chenopodium quinoa]